MNVYKYKRLATRLKSLVNDKSSNRCLHLIAGSVKLLYIFHLNSTTKKKYFASWNTVGDSDSIEARSN